MKKIVIANWKMNPSTLEEAQKIARVISRGTKRMRRTHTVLCPPMIYIPYIQDRPHSMQFSVGAQDVFWEEKGAYTGEISANMLGDLGVSYVIVGHSERRALGESNIAVAKKIKASLKEGLDVVLCIGEKERDSHGKYLSFLTEQINSALQNVKRTDLKYITIAYEPIWAIGKEGEDAIDSHKLYQTSLFVRKVISHSFGPKQAREVRIIYGGSVEPENAKDLIQNGNVSGFLVGHVSLDPKLFLEIVHAVESS